MKSDDIKAILTEAEAIALSVSQPFQVAAFNQSVHMLAGDRDQGTSVKRASARAATAVTGASEPAKLFQSLDSTAYPDLLGAETTLDRALWILRVAREQFGVDDGLTADVVARVLTEKFRIRTTRDSVRVAFDRAPDLVDRVLDGGGAARYRIMAAGDSYLSTHERKRIARKRRGGGSARGGEGVSG